MQKFNKPSLQITGLVLTIIGFLTTVIVHNLFEMNGSEMSFIEILAFVIASGLYFIAGLFVERHNRLYINDLVDNGKYVGIQKNTTFNPGAVNSTKPLQFLRLWYFTVIWPHFMWVIFRAKKKHQQ